MSTINHIWLANHADELKVRKVRRSSDDPEGYEVLFDDFVIFSKVRKEDVQLLKGLVVIRLLTRKYKIPTQ